MKKKVIVNHRMKPRDTFVQLLFRENEDEPILLPSSEYEVESQFKKQSILTRS